jgi:hypothetical protein
MSAGYSATPLAKKLGVKVGHRLVLVHAPPGWSIDDLPERVEVARRRSSSQADIVIAFFTRLERLQRELADLSQQISVHGSLWLAWPRRAGGRDSNITDNYVRASVLPLGLVDVKVAALDDDWSGLKMVWRKELRPRLTSID